MSHPLCIPGYDLVDLAYQVEGLQYDKTLEFLNALRQAFLDRAQKDLEADRILLAYRLGKTAVALEEAVVALTEVWEICEPRMGK